MIKRFKYIIILILLLLLPNNINAACSSSDKARLKKIISNINVSYDYQMVQDNAIFSIKFSNLHPEIYFKDSYGTYYRQYDENNEIILYNFVDGKSYTFTFYGVGTCAGENVGNLYVNIPMYNPYYKMSVCDDAKEFELCQKWVSHSLSRSQFIEKVNEYKSKKIVIDNNDVNKKISVIDFAMSFIRMYGLYILIGIVLIIIIIKFVRYKKDTFGF